MVRGVLIALALLVFAGASPAYAAKPSDEPNTGRGLSVHSGGRPPAEEESPPAAPEPDKSKPTDTSAPASDGMAEDPDLDSSSQFAPLNLSPQPSAEEASAPAQVEPSPPTQPDDMPAAPAPPAVLDSVLSEAPTVDAMPVAAPSPPPPADPPVQAPPVATETPPAETPPAATEAPVADAPAPPAEPVIEVPPPAPPLPAYAPIRPARANALTVPTTPTARFDDNPTRFIVGQVWTLKPPAADSLRVRIGRIDDLAGRLIISVTVLGAPCPPALGCETRDIAHMPFEQPTLTAAVDHVVARDQFPDRAFEQGYRYWRESARGAAWTIPPAEAASIGLEALVPRTPPPAPASAEASPPPAETPATTPAPAAP